jgi:hypothetical protein
MSETYIGPKPPGMCVNHKNGVKTDNRPANLEYVSFSRNVKHGLGHKRVTKFRNKPRKQS